MVWEVEDRSDEGQAEEEEDDGVCFAIGQFCARSFPRQSIYVQKANFS